MLFGSSAAYRGELTSHHPRFHPDSPAACRDIDIETAKQLLPNALTVGIHMGSFGSLFSSLIRPLANSFTKGTWHKPGDRYDASKVHEDIKYTKEDDDAIDDWIGDHVETTWHSLGTCGMCFCLTQIVGLGTDLVV